MPRFLLLASTGVTFAIVLFVAGVQPASEAKYQLVPAGLQLPDGFAFGEVTGLACDAQDNLYVFHRGKQPLAVFDKTGKFLRAWGDGVVKTAHSVRVDPDGNIWTTDLGTHQVIKYDATGKILLTLGTKNQAGESPTTFNKPADTAFAPNGDVYVADGYGNSRVVQFSKDGKFVRAWGKKGKGRGEFHLVHAAVYDAKADRLYIGDRENKRVQIFTPEGKYLEEWNNTGHPYGIALFKGDFFLADGVGSAVRKMDVRGMIHARFGSKGREPGEFDLPHGISVDSQGSIYVSDVKGKRVQKFAAAK